jgi:hypothetical protein
VLCPFANSHTPVTARATKYKHRMLNCSDKLFSETIIAPGAKFPSLYLSAMMSTSSLVMGLLPSPTNFFKLYKMKACSLLIDLENR